MKHLMETLDAVLSAPLLETPAHLSLTPMVHRSWSSGYDALHAGTMDLGQLETQGASRSLDPTTTWFAVDASVWPRCDAETSPERGYYHHPYRPSHGQSHGQPIVAGVDLLVVGAVATAVLELDRLDRSAARPAHHRGREREPRRRRADPLVAGANA
jgi:hypothetical protein